MVAARVSSWKFPPKFKLSTWAIWSAFTAKISNSSTKQMCAESGFCALQEVGKIHFARQVLVAEGYYPTLNNKWWDGYQSQKVVIMEDVDKKQSSSFTTTLRFWVLGEAQWFWGLGGGVGGGGRFLEPVFLPWNSGPFSITGALFRSGDFIGRCEGKFMEIPPKFKLSTWAIWSAFTAKISNSSTKQMCAESGFCALQESARSTLPAKCW